MTQYRRKRVLWIAVFLPISAFLMVIGWRHDLAIVGMWMLLLLVCPAFVHLMEDLADGPRTLYPDIPKEVPPPALTAPHRSILIIEEEP